MKTHHPHFCSDCGKDYECRVTEPCHLDTAELCLAHYLARDAQLGPKEPHKRALRSFFRVADWFEEKKP